MNTWKMSLVLAALALPAATLGAQEHSATAAKGDRDVPGGVANAFRTAGNGVAYGVHEVGRTVTGGRRNARENARADRYRARMYHRALQTRRDLRGY
jgi:hypothetical protein